MGKAYQKIKRGMVFWFNLDESVNKYNFPKVEVRGKSFKDYKQYGSRNWLVISNDIGNNESPTCNIVPITTSETKSNMPTHVSFNCRGNIHTILCEQIMTVNQVELVDYDYTVSDDVMKKVEDALRVQMSIRDKKPEYLDGVEASMDKIESIIENIIREKVNEIASKRAGRVDIEDAVLRLGEGLESLFSKVTSDKKEPTKEVNNVVEEKIDETVKDVDGIIKDIDKSASKEESTLKEYSEKAYNNGRRPYKKRGNKTNSAKPKNTLKNNNNKYKGQSAVEKFYSRYGSVQKPKAEVEEKTEVKIEEPVKETKEKVKKKRRSWDEESMRSFLNDVETMQPEDVAKKWEMGTVLDMYKCKYYVKNKLDALEAKK